ncbi:MAG: tetratricopeptide repeat protein [Acidobacteria bacterium]|nr:tetratricopeptide repeat protein [Acidobacteriota bacterium]
MRLKHNRYTSFLVLLLPFAVFGTGVYLYVQTENEAYVQFARGQEQWRDARYTEAVNLYRTVFEQYPKSRYADDALWETALIYHASFYDVNRAVQLFERLVADYPKSSHVKECYLRLAEIYETQWGDLNQAIQYWSQGLKAEPSMKARQRILFRMATANFKSNNFEIADKQFRQLIREGQEEHLVEQSQVRFATLLQIQRKYGESTRIFEEVLKRTSCNDCRLQAQLGVVENHELTDALDKAIQMANRIRPEDYPVEMRESLLQRLQEKKRYNRASLWKAR